MNRDRLRENRIHGLPSYPISVYEVSETSGKTLFDCHWHDEMEFMLVTEGQLKIQLDMQEYLVYPGEAVFVAGGRLHGAFPDGGMRCSLHAVVCHPDFLASKSYDTLQQRYMEPLLRRQIVVPSIIRNDTEAERTFIRHLQALIEANTAQDGAYEMVTKSHLYMMLAYLLADQQTAPARAGSQQVERLKQALSYFHRHFHEPVRLKDLALELNMSEEHFCRFFKKMMKKSPVAYLNEYRMKQAANLLVESDCKILDVALQVGFENMSYFITVFKAHYGVTPSQYRKLHA